MEIFDINKINDYDKDDLELFLSKEKAYLSSGEALLEATLKIPFKNKEKVDKLLDKIKQHKSNMCEINNQLYYTLFSEGIEPSEKQASNLGTILVGGEHLIWGSKTGTAYDYSYTSYSPMIVVDLIQVKYIDNNNDIITIKVLDDVFESILGNYYLVMEQGVHVPLNRVIEIDEESNMGKWYSVMCKNFDRETKLKRVLKDDEI